jgi:hypothetical protein
MALGRVPLVRAGVVPGAVRFSKMALNSHTWNNYDKAPQHRRALP